jgi:hypothetical protein
LNEFVEGLQLRNVSTEGLKFRHQNFSGNIPHKTILSEGTPTHSADCRIETPAAGLICGANLLCRMLRARMKVDADFDPGFEAERAGYRFSDAGAGRNADGIGKRDLTHA